MKAVKANSDINIEVDWNKVSLDPGVITIYSDGSCSDNQSKENFGGYGFIIVLDQERFVMMHGSEVNTTNNRMEMQAVIQALGIVTAHKEGRSLPIKLHTDSAYISNCFKNKWYETWRDNGWRTSKKKAVDNQDLWVKMIELYESHGSVEIIKVKGHKGIELNEVADKLATHGTERAKANSET